MFRKVRNKGELNLEATLENLRAYRKRDPRFERAIADYVDAESSLQEDPDEGKKAEVPPESSSSRTDPPEEALYLLPSLEGIALGIEVKPGDLSRKDSSRQGGAEIGWIKAKLRPSRWLAAETPDGSTAPKTASVPLRNGCGA